MSILIKGKDMPDDCKIYDGLMGVRFVYDEDEIDNDINFFLTDPAVIEAEE